jgi:hypothetical protein
VARRAAVVVAVLTLGAVGGGCGDDGRLAAQRAEARARTCASLVQRRYPERIVADPEAAYAVLLARSGPDAYAARSRDDSSRPRSSIRELLDGCAAPPASP